jgi:hypothetical protein
MFVGVCVCIERMRNELKKKFIYSHGFGGYIDVDGPRRRNTWKSKLGTAGEPYIYRDCPWCGGELSPPGLLSKETP